MMFRTQAAARKSLEYYERIAWFSENERNMIEILRHDAFVVAERQTGKSTALLMHVTATGAGKWAVVSPNHELSLMLKEMWRRMYPKAASGSGPHFVCYPEQLCGLYKDFQLAADEVFMLDRLMWKDFEFRCGVGSVDKRIVAVKRIW